MELELEDQLVMILIEKFKLEKIGISFMDSDD